MKNSTLLKIILIYFLQSSLSANVLTGKVVSVTDGDTIKILTENHIQYKIRLTGIDAPERSQAFGKKSTKNLAKYVAGRRVNIHYSKKDKYGRTLGTIYINDVDINLQQIKDGFAWVYKKYCNRQDYYDAEKHAKSKNLGLWYDRYPIPPWEYRHRK